MRPVRAAFTLAALLFAGLACSAQAAPRRIPLGPPATEVAFRAYGAGLLPIDASFARFEGWLTYDPDDRASCQVELHVQVASMVTQDQAMRDTIVGPDFMDAAQASASSTIPGRARRRGSTACSRCTGSSGHSRCPWTGAATALSRKGRLVRAEWGMTAMSFLGGRTVRIRVTVPLAGSREQVSHP